MLGKLVMPPSLTCNCTRFSVNSLDLPSSSSATLPRQNLSSSVTNYHNISIQKNSYTSVLASDNWRSQSTGSTQATVLTKDEEGKKAWNECRELISAINFSHSEADTMLSKAFGWAHSPFWGEERSKEVPDKELVNGILEYLRSVGLSDDDLHKLLKKFPEVLGCILDDNLKMNVASLEREWGIKGKSLRSLLLRNPKVLGYNVDCKGDCIAKCTRCWVRF